MRVRVAIAAVVIGVAFVVTLLLRRTPEDPQVTPSVAAAEGAQTDILSLDGAATKGNRKARLAVVIFSDFQCPFCAHFADTTFRSLDDDYIAEGKVLFAFRHMPLSNHPHAVPAAAAATCAGRQGKFWEMHDRLFANAKTLATAPWRTFADDLGLNRAQFDACLDKEGPETVRADLALTETLELAGTPSFLIGRILPDGRVKVSNRLAGALPIGSFKGILDPLLAQPPAK